MSKEMWDYLKGKGYSDIAVAGIMGNLYAESGLVPNNLQQIYNASLGMTDEEYTRAVDQGTYTNFVRDMAGYGLAQWTFWSRKEALLQLAKSRGRSIADLYVQLDHLCNELQEFGLTSKLNACNTVRDASNIMLFEFEKPYDTGTQVQNARANWSQEFYDKYAGTQITAPAADQPASSQQEYCVMAFLRCPDKTTARQKLSAVQAAGFQGIITVSEP